MTVAERSGRRRIAGVMLFATAALVMPAMWGAGCATSDAQARQATLAAEHAQARAARAEAAAERAREAAEQAQIAADRAQKAVEDATREINRVSDHLDRMNREAADNGD
ncbi:MAG TPA: hypothetical protein VJN94_11065 [Candidatus Binataceae bacterium]|nr:hypothetical protein [Candidatus Binataceae bacterium]